MFSGLALKYALLLLRPWKMNLELLVKPLESALGPCGEDLMFSAEFDEIQDARRFDDPSIAQGEWVTDVKEADWGRVIRVCEALLGNRSKDLRLAAWLTEAWARSRGLAGLADGYTLLTLLCEAYWENVHPLPEDGDLDQRIGNFDWLVTQTARLIREAVLTNSPKGKYSFNDLESARTLAKNVERLPGQAEMLTSGARVTLEAFEAARRDTPSAFFVSGMEEAERLKTAVTTLQTMLDQLMGSMAPGFGNVLDVLDDVFRAFRRYAEESGGLAAKAVPGAAESPSVAAAGEPAGGVANGAIGGPVRSREQAIQQLQEIAAFFKRTEPHSPVAYLAEKAARWGTMSLHEWLRTVVKDDSALSRVEELLGVEPPSVQDGYN
jgi:type VI secretion system protein ImpA